MNRVLVLCTGNSARSQMAEGLLRHQVSDRIVVESAGTHPTHVRPEAIEVMKEIGIDITSHRSKHVGEFSGQHFDHVITVCDQANESCPVFPGAPNRLHWSFRDPAAVTDAQSRLETFRSVRDGLRAAIEVFAAQLRR